MISFPDTSLDAAHSLNPFEKSVLLHLIGAAKPKTILELGVYRGVTTKLISEWLKQFNVEATIVGFDLEDVLQELISSDPAINELTQQGNVKFMPGYLPGTLDEFLKQHNGPIDFALIDAQHDYHSVFGELSRIWPYLSNKGFIVCHDYHKPRIQYAVEKFARKTKAKYLPILATPDDSVVYSSLVILTKPKMQYEYFRWLMYRFHIKKRKGYYWLKKIFPDFFRNLD